MAAEHRSRSFAQAALLLLLAAPAAAAPPTDAAEYPPRLRICCALGHDLELRLGVLRPPVGVENVVARGALGHHRYRARTVFEERNGLVYTCRGGFIDLGHLRSAADLYAHLRARLEAARGGPVALATADGGATLLAPPTSDSAAQAAFDLTVWHEITTGAGGRVVPFFSETFSAFSPEDLYSDLLGATLGARAWARPEPWDQALDAEMDAALEALGALDLDATRRALDQVEGRWWSAEVPVPGAGLLLRRNLAFGPTLHPWLVPEPTALGCKEGAPAPLHRPAASGVQLTLTPPEGSNLGPGPFTPADFEALVAQVARTTPQSASGGRSSAQPGEARDGSADETLSGIRILGVRATAGAVGARAAGGLEVVGARADGPGGDLAIIRYTTLYTAERGLVTHFTGIQAQRLFFCQEPGGRLHPPVAAWFQACAPRGVFGLGGTLAQVQHDGATGRWAMRPVEAHASFALLDNALDPTFPLRNLVLSTGLALENVTWPGLPGRFTPRAHLQLQGVLRTEDGAWGAAGLATFRQSLRGLDDQALEASVSAERRWHLRDGPRAAPWAVLSLALEVGYSRWTRPEAALDDLMWPLASTTAQGTLRGLVVLAFSLERLVF
ncbi:MAG: DUF4056 domain-containing protein [Myxococcales bacterium]|nr:DUF4056 domain-containing protein [Myxococcales bacterium]MCB9648518.1 DUF4056 domain-containing protein [Deltaproteobacteria bacterium]